MLNKILSTVLLAFSFAYSQSSFFIQPSAYFTYGNYSDKTVSNQLTSFLGLSFGQSNYLVAGYDNINIKNDLWKYEQENFAFGFHYWINDWKMKIKTDFLSIKGKYTDDYITKPLLDNGFLVSPEIVFGVYPFYYGFGYSYFSQKVTIN